MMDLAIRTAVLGLIGFILCAALAWYFSFLLQEIRGTGHVIIAPVTVINSDGKGDSDLGNAMAQMLQARLQSLVDQLRNAQDGFTANLRASSLTHASISAPVGDVRLWTQGVALQAGLLQPVDMKLSVAGVEVGGMLPWLQRKLSNRRTLHFTVYMHSSGAQVFGNLSALGVSDAGVHLKVKGIDDKPPPFDLLVDGLAHEIVHRYLARDKSNKLESLESSEFVALSGILVSVAQANKKCLRGSPAQSEFAALIPTITQLSDKVPEWPELGYLAARIADSGRDSQTALIYYKRVHSTFERSGQSEIVRVISGRISELSAIADDSVSTMRSEPIPGILDYSEQIKIVKSSETEGSVVGLAFASALEFQVTKVTGIDQQISGRHIYYAARKRGGLGTEHDTGAYLKDAIAFLSEEGAVAEEIWPYHAGEYNKPPPPAIKQAKRYRISNSKELSSVDQIKHALNKNGPVVAGFSLFQGSMEPNVSKSGVIPLPSKNEQVVGGHVVVIVGYDDEKRRFKFVNSWGKEWGKKGFGYVSYDYLSKHGNGSWTFTLDDR